MIVGALVCTGAVGACGSSGAGSTGAGGNISASALRFSECMRSHGLSNFPDPSPGGGGIRLKISSGLNPFSPAFRSAQAACRKLLPGGAPGNGPPSAQMKARLLAISMCMRAHGVTDFPDPTSAPPSSQGAYSIVLGAGGVFLAVPRTISVDSPAFKQAGRACHFGSP